MTSHNEECCEALKAEQEAHARTRGEIARLRATVDFLWRRINPRTIEQEKELQLLWRDLLVPDFTTFTLFCGCKVFRDDSRVLCHHHAPTGDASHKVLTTGKTLLEHQQQAIADKAKS